MTTTFLSTPPSRVATVTAGPMSAGDKFLSTPPSRVATEQNRNSRLERFSFYPRHPRGWRRIDRIVLRFDKERFLSTPPSRVATPLDMG